LNWRTQGQGSPPEARLRKRCNGGEPNSLIKIPTAPNNGGGALVWVPARRTMRLLISRKNFKYRSKSITQRKT
jgi:hypothetical protein